MSRPLSTAEHINWVADQVVSLNFVMVACLSGDIKETHLRKALDIVQERHFPLKCRIKKEPTPQFVTDRVPQIPLQILKRKNENYWIEKAEEEMSKPLPWEKGPLVRVLLLKSENKYDLLVTFCHVIADATSGVKFIQHLLSIMNNLSSGIPQENERPLPELPAVHELIKSDLKFPRGFFPDIQDHIRRIFHQPRELTGDLEVPPDQRITRVIHRILSQTETQKFVNKCKTEKTSVHSVLSAAMLQAVVQQIRKLKDVPQKGPLLIGCITPVNIRHYFSKPVEECIGNFISYALHYQLIDDNAELWATARKVKKAIKRQLKFGKDIKPILNTINILELYPDPINMLRDLSRLSPPVGASNIGKLDIPEKFGDFTLEKLHFTVVINTGAKNGFAIAVTTFHKCLTINFLYADPYISEKRAIKIVESTMKKLKDAIS